MSPDMPLNSLRIDFEGVLKPLFVGYGVICDIGFSVYLKLQVSPKAQQTVAKPLSL
jgi:hypothetical protein